MSSPVDKLEVSIATRGNLDGLRQCLTSVLVGSCIPQVITIHVESDPLREFSDFYLSQLTSLAREFSVKLSIVARKPEGIYKLRQDQLSYFPAKEVRWVLFLDDDVVLRHDAIYNLGVLGVIHQAYRESEKLPPCGFYQGTKWDVSNLRGYADFQLKRVDPVTATNHNVPVDRTGVSPLDLLSKFNKSHTLNRHLFEPTYFCDTGFCMFDRRVAESNSLSFVHHSTNTPAGGEDALFALLCEKKSVPRMWIKIAEAVHLEKPAVRFSEHAYRKEAVLRAAESLGYPTNQLASFLSWVPIYESKGSK